MPVTDGALSERAAPRGTTQWRRDLAREQIAQIQRARMLAAMTQLACEKGVGDVTVAHVVARSGVSRRTFYEIFEDREDCLLAALDEAVARASRYLIETGGPHEKWVDRVRASLVALLQFLDDEPAFGQLAVVESLAGGPAALRRRSYVLADLTAFVDRGRDEARRSAEPPPFAAEGVVGAVFLVIHSRMLELRCEPFVGLVNPLMAMIVLPYLGAGASRRELARTAPSGRERVKPAPLDPWSMLDMRLTYRTARVLRAIGSHPGSSNRGIADIADVGDPGQMSKLLARLRYLGLIENAEIESVRGAPNAWRLTKKGKEIERAVAAQAPRC